MNPVIAQQLIDQVSHLSVVTTVAAAASVFSAIISVVTLILVSRRY